ncbi:hypothetical protein B5C34_05245 [Pacificimonas flava]|uniref:DUF2190 domain-containing protein n=2 Tax=Pacificimonas TaxID=1960290 RepID=A0A219B3K0_9SPHN|nr:MULTISPECIES: capsid cement protein [Pacificimonas]MBZ6377376.1 DUF2190 family protein [Pacificimonas aurantium]OWV32917.1 hypothetical protein B5C34_05245 [Pacificimonas flava]
MQKKPILTLSVAAAEALTKNRFVSHDGSQTGAGEKAFGVAPYDVAAGEAAPLDVIGTTLLELGGTVTVGMGLKADASGRAVDHGGAGSLNARALQAGAIGDVVEAILIP